MRSSILWDEYSAQSIGSRFGESQPEEANDEDSGTKDRPEGEETQEDRYVPGKVNLRDLPQSAPVHGEARIQA